MATIAPESAFPTINDVRDRLNELIEKGLGSLPAQCLVVPDSTMQIVARALGDESSKPALAIDLFDDTTKRMPVMLISTERLRGSDGGMPSLRHQ